MYSWYLKLVVIVCFFLIMYMLQLKSYDIYNLEAHEYIPFVAQTTELRNAPTKNAYTETWTRK